MIIERIQLDQLRGREYTSTLQALSVGESVYCTDMRQAQSLRALSYYLVRSRGLDWKFTFRKMDRGWRIIRIK